MSRPADLKGDDGAETLPSSAQESEFDLGTWHGLGYSGRPEQAPPADQDSAAQKLYSERVEPERCRLQPAVAHPVISCPP